MNGARQFFMQAYSISIVPTCKQSDPEQKKRNNKKETIAVWVNLNIILIVSYKGKVSYNGMGDICLGFFMFFCMLYYPFQGIWASLSG